jgi:hypothetical protein
MVAKIPLTFTILIGICIAYGIYEYVTDVLSLRKKAGPYQGGAQKKNETLPSNHLLPLQQPHLHSITEEQISPKQLLGESNGTDPMSQNRSNINTTIQNIQPNLSKEEGSVAQNKSPAVADSSQPLAPGPNPSIAAINATANATTDIPIKSPFVPLEVDFAAISGGNTTIKAGNYFQLLQQGTFGQWASELPPVQLIMTYIQSHSQQALERVWHECGNETCAQFDSMSFVVGRYSCPLEAGNRIVRFLNHLVWAIITDRVFLWGYWDKNACLTESAGGNLDSWCSEMVNSVADCKEILKLASWVPSWDEWSLKLNLTQPIRACAVGNQDRDAIAFPMDGPQVPRVIRVGQQINLQLGVLLSQRRDRGILTRRGASQRRAGALFGTRGYQGVFFTYGMLFESVFSLHPSLLPNHDVLAIDNDKVNSYALHSRHQNKNDPGHNIGLDKSCMKTVLTNQTAGKACIVYTMTDRLATKQQLPEALAHFNCTAIFSKNTTAGKSHSSEHGPFAGRGYYEDIALAQYARQGFMSPNVRGRPRVGPRTSSGLPRSIIEFRRVVESSSDAEVPGFRETFST